MAEPSIPRLDVIDILEGLTANGERGLKRRANDSSNDFEQARARQGLIALARLRRKLLPQKEDC